MNWLKKIVILIAVIFSGLFFIYYFSTSFNFFLFSYKEIEVPNILGKELKEAEKILKQKKLYLVISDSRFSDKIPENFIIEQSPYSGKKVRENRDIFVVVSSGYNLVAVPDLKGYSLREAKILLSNFKLKLRKVNEASFPQVPLGKIFEQTPQAGEKVKKGTEVDVSINITAESQIKALNWEGKDIKEVKQDLENLNLQLGEITWIWKEEAPRFTVISQNIQPGENIYPESLLSFQVSAGSPYDSLQFKQGRLIFVVPGTSDLQEVKVVLSDQTGSSVIYKSKHYGGETVELSVSSFGQAEAILYLNNKIEKRLQL